MFEFNSLVALKAPLSVNLEITEKCNLSCSFCFNAAPAYIDSMSDENKKRLEKVQSIGIASENFDQPNIHQERRDRLFSIVDRLADSGVFEIRLFGGEFTVFKYWQEVMRYAHKRGFFISFVSNGYLLLEKDIDTLSECGVRDCTISLHGLADTHDVVVGRKGAFNRARDCIARLKSRGIAVCIAYTPTVQTIGGLYEFVSTLTLEQGVKDFSISRLFQDSRYKNLSLSDYHRLLAEIARCHRELGVNISLADSFPRCKTPIKYWPFLSYCSQGTAFGQVDFNGNIKHCSATSGSLGNVLEGEVSFLWGESLSSMRSLAHLPKSCKICPIFCGGGCTVSRGVDKVFALDEFISLPSDENWTQATARAIYNRFRKIVFEMKKSVANKKAHRVEQERPKIRGRYAIRYEGDDKWIAFFQESSPLFLSSFGVEVLKRMDGSRTVHEIARECRELGFVRCTVSAVKTIVVGIA